MLIGLMDCPSVRHQQLAESFGSLAEFFVSCSSELSHADRWQDVAAAQVIIVHDRSLSVRACAELLRNMRERGFAGGLLLLSDRDEAQCICAYMSAGADQWMSSKGSGAELSARVRSLQRRGQPSRADRLSYDDIVLDLQRLEAFRGGRPLGLSGRPLALLELFLRSPDQVLTREQISHAVWGQTFDPLSNVIEVTISKLRQALHQQDDQPLLHTVVKRGYMLSTSPPKSANSTMRTQALRTPASTSGQRLTRDESAMAAVSH